jgi:TonB family protein
MLLCPALLLLAACSRPPSVLKGAYPAGTPQYQIAVDSVGKKHGPEYWWFDNGKARYQARNVHGLRDGAYRAWYPSGSMWYQGRDSLGIHRDTLKSWNPEGRLEAIRVFDHGLLVYLESIDSSGLTKADKKQIEEERKRLAAALEAKVLDSVAASDKIRRNSLSLWSLRVRTSVETYWIPPKRSGSVDHKAVARIHVRPDGRIESVTWLQKSAWKAFNDKAARALKRMKRFPALPSEAGGGPLDVRYEFVSLGKKPKTGKLVLKSPQASREEVEEEK